MQINKVSVWLGGISNKQILSLEALGVTHLQLFINEHEELLNLHPCFIPKTVRVLEFKYYKPHEMRPPLPERSGF